MPLASWQQVSIWFQTAAATQASATRTHQISGETASSLEQSVVRRNVEVTIERAEAALAALDRFTGDHMPSPPEIREPDSEQ